MEAERYGDASGTGPREWSIQEIAKLVGTTSRTLRHYGAIGLLPPSRTGVNGYRYYDEPSLMRLQRILLLRELGLGLPHIAEVLSRDTSEERALTVHLAWLREEQDRLARRIASVESTIEARRGKEPLMAENMFDGFDNTRHRAEVEERWGQEAYAAGDAWWHAKDAEGRAEWTRATERLTQDWVAAATSGADPEGAEAQELARRHVSWLRAVPGTPAAKGRDVKGYVIGLGEMYVADPRFSANYAATEGDQGGAEFVRDALRIYAETNL